MTQPTTENTSHDLNLLDSLLDATFYRRSTFQPSSSIDLRARCSRYENVTSQNRHIPAREFRGNKIITKDENENEEIIHYLPSNIKIWQYSRCTRPKAPFIPISASPTDSNPNSAISAPITPTTTTTTSTTVTAPIMSSPDEILSFQPITPVRQEVMYHQCLQTLGKQGSLLKVTPNVRKRDKLASPPHPLPVKKMMRARPEGRIEPEGAVMSHVPCHDIHQTDEVSKRTMLRLLPTNVIQASCSSAFRPCSATNSSHAKFM